MYSIKLSPYHKIFYNEWKLDPLSSKYNIVFDQTLSTSLDIQCLQQALHRIILEYLILNSHVEEFNGDLSWVKNSTIKNLEYFDFYDSEQIFKYISCAFNLNTEPLYRFALFKDLDSNYRFIIVFHHIIIDGNSFDKFIDTISNYYNNSKYCANLNLDCQEALINKSINSLSNTLNKISDSSRQFWHNTLSDTEPVDLRFLKLSSITQTLQDHNPIKEIRFEFGYETLQQTLSLKEKLGVSSYAYSMIIFATLLNRYTSQSKFAISYPNVIKEMTGLFYGVGINTNLYIPSFGKDTTILKLITQYQEYVKAIKDNCHYYCPIDQILLEKNKELVDVFFAKTNLKDYKLTLHGVTTLSMNKNFNIDLPAKLAFEHNIYQDNIYYRVRYNESQVDAVILKQFIYHYKKLFIDILSDLHHGIANKHLSEYRILTAEEYQHIVFDYNKTAKPYPRDKTIHQLFEEQVLKTPDNVAIVYKDVQLTYSELNQRSNQLAHYIKVTYKIQPDDLIALYLDRSELMLIAILAILKSGAAYVPIDPRYPIARTRFIIEDTKTKAILTQQHYSTKFQEINTNSRSIIVEAIDIIKVSNTFSDDNVSSGITSSNLAYVIYTSGTTGKPKGVMIEHRSVINLIENVLHIFFDDNLSINYKCLWYANYVFDAHVWELFAPITSGSQVYIVPEDKRSDIEQLCEYINNNNIEIATIPPSLLTTSHQLKLKKLILAGEKAHPTILDYYHQNNVCVINAYGLTETTVCATLNNYNANGYYNIGTPLFNVKTYVLNDDLIVQPIGAIGELYIGGDCLARGYINDAGLTNNHFILNSLFTKKDGINNIRLYKTGDLVRLLPNGNIEYVGRNDSQVKIRGYRIELSEIENQLLSYPAIQYAVVTANSRVYTNITEKYLAAYYVSYLKIDEVQLSSYLHSKLPAYMVPISFNQIEQMPLTLNGKLNYALLPEPKPLIQNRYVAPMNEQEYLICNAFSQVLGVYNIGTNDDFFKLGGSSINAITLASVLQTNFDIHISDIFDLRTPRKISEKAVFKANFIVNKLNSIKLMYAQRKLINKNSDVIKQANSCLNISDTAALDLTKHKQIVNVLLSGATGYLGCNILYQLLNYTSYNVFLLVRWQPNISAKERINNKYKLYFNKELHVYSSRISIFECNLEKEYLDLAEEEYKYLILNTDSIIHCAALVSHYSSYDKLFSANVQATINLLELAKFTKLKDFHYISTSSVLYFNNHAYESNVYTENSLADDLSKCKNMYVETKAQGEQQAIRYRKYGVKSNIYRIGNLAFMLSNYTMQENIDDSAFFYWIKCIFQLKCIAQDIGMLELSPVDLTAEAIIKLFDKQALENSTHHVFNPYQIDLTSLYKNCEQPAIKVLSIEDFIDCLIWHMEHRVCYNLIIRFLLHQAWLDDDITHITKRVQILQNKTQHILQQIGFTWVKIEPSVFNTYIASNSDKIFDSRGVNIMLKKEKIFEYLEIIAPILPAPIYWLNKENVLLGANEAALKMIGADSLRDIIGKKAYDVYPEEMARSIIEHDNEVMRTGKTLSQEETTKKVIDGSIGYVVSIKSPLYDDGGNVIGIVGTSIDITAQKESERLQAESKIHLIEKQQQEKFKKIVEQVVHDIRSPITTLQMVIPNCEINPERARVTVNQSAIKIQDIANQLLVRFKPQNGTEDNVNTASNRAPTLVSADILEIIAEKRYEYSQLTLDLNYKITKTGHFAFINIDVRAFRCMMSNLINNAVDALNGCLGSITVHLNMIDNKVIIIVEDDGCGMPESVKEKILNNISVTSGKEDGHGIGFRQIRDTLAANEGKLSIESTPEVGTQIILTFPQVEAPDWICNHITFKHDDFIIILDDDPSIHGAWDARFKKDAPNIRYQHFEQGNDAINFINSLSDEEKNHIFILSDYELLKQDMNGLDVIHETRISRSVLVTSHHNSEEVRSKARASKTKILPKPLAAEIVINVLNASDSSKIKKATKKKTVKRVDWVIVDDDDTLLNLLTELIFVDKIVDTYKIASDFLNVALNYDKNTKFLIDNQFKGETITGIELAIKLHELGFDKLYLFSGQDFSNDGSVPDFLNVIIKTDIDAVQRLADNK